MYRLCVILLTLALGMVFESAESNMRVDANPGTGSIEKCASVDEISTSVTKLASPLTDSELDEVRAVLFNNAKRSQKCRQAVITTLIKAMDQPNLDLLSTPGTYDTWTYAARILGELKAVEALDLLIGHLNSTDGLSININHFPAVGGIVTMGPIAIPKLASALKTNSDRYVRKHAIFCLASIGGPSAKQILEQVLHSESDRCNREFIMASLSAFKNKKTPNRIIFDPERSAWYASLYCHN